MPYNEYEEQAWEYFEIGKEKLALGNKGEARNSFNMAYNIASKNSMSQLMSLIQTYLNKL